MALLRFDDGITEEDYFFYPEKKCINCKVVNPRPQKSKIIIHNILILLAI